MADLTETDLASMLRAEQENNLLLQESLADLELAAEDRGWSKLGAEGDDFSDDGRKKIAETSALARLANPLIKRGMQLRVAYIWGQGVSVSVPDADPDLGVAQNVNEVVQAFLDHPSNRDTFTGAGAHEDNENQLGTDGEIFFCLPTNPLTGEVVVRLIEPDEITEIITDPEDSTRHRFYRRQYVAKVINARGERAAPQQVTVFYPAHDYNPRGIDRLNLIDKCPVKWHEPVRAMVINRPKRRSMRGLGDIYPALAWARSSKEVLEAWVLLFKALTRYAYQLKTKNDRVQKAAAQLRAQQPAPIGNPNNVGATFTGGNETSLEAVSKTGAQIDANAARPIIMMVAAAFGVPITMLLGDPGVTGARAVAATLDQPMELVMRMRRDQWSEVYTDVLTYVINWAVKAGKLRGTVRFEGDREVVELAGGQDRTVKVDWPEFDSTPIRDKVEAIRIADDTGKLPPEVTLAQLLTALKVDNADEIWDANTDDKGKFIPLDVVASQARDAFARQGGDTGTTDPIPEDEPVA